MRGKLAILTLAFVLSSVGLKAQDDSSASFGNYSYDGSNGCSSFGACDSNWSTVTDSSALKSLGWQYSGNSWQMAFTPGQLQSLAPSWTDQMNAVQASMQQALQNAESAVQGALTWGNAREAFHIGADAVVEHAEEKPAGPFAAGLSYASLAGALSEEEEQQVESQNPQAITIDPTALPLSARSGSANPSTISQGSGPFTIVDPGSVTIVDPPFTGDPSTIIDLNSKADLSKATIVDPPSTGDRSTVIDLNTDAEAQQILLQAKQSQQSLASEQQQLQSQASQYQIQNQQSIQQSEILVQAATNYALSNAAGNVSQRNVQSGNSASTGNGLQSLGQALSSLSKVGQSSQTSKSPTVRAMQPDPEGRAAAQLVNVLKASGVIQTPGTQSATPALSLGPTGVTCQFVGPKQIQQCTGTLPSYMTPPH